MAIDFQQVHEQVQQMGVSAPDRERIRREKHQLAERLLNTFAQEFEWLREKVARIMRTHDPHVRCGQPPDAEVVKPSPLNTSLPLPPLPSQVTILAADGSQIDLDRHVEVEYCLVNVGAIHMRLGDPRPPQSTVKTKLFYDQELYTPTGQMTEGLLALMRDQQERALLADLAEEAPAPVITFTDGPMELWGAKESGEEASIFQEYLSNYKAALHRLCARQVVAAGYVDRPAANLIVRLLEIAQAPEEQLPYIRTYRPLRGVTDIHLYSQLLNPGERSATFAIQSSSSKDYEGPLALHFFYINVGRAEHPSLARVEIPAWVAQNPASLDLLHAVLVEQCRIMGSRPYPYLLHRAHETARVSLQEKEQVTQVIALELRRQGVEVWERSPKQASKELGGRKRHP